MRVRDRLLASAARREFALQPLQYVFMLWCCVFVVSAIAFAVNSLVAFLVLMPSLVLYGVVSVYVGIILIDDHIKLERENVPFLRGKLFTGVMLLLLGALILGLSTVSFLELEVIKHIVFPLANPMALLGLCVVCAVFLAIALLLVGIFVRQRLKHVCSNQIAAEDFAYSRPDNLLSRGWNWSVGLGYAGAEIQFLVDCFISKNNWQDLGNEENLYTFTAGSLADRIQLIEYLCRLVFPWGSTSLTKSAYQLLQKLMAQSQVKLADRPWWRALNTEETARSKAAIQKHIRALEEIYAYTTQSQASLIHTLDNLDFTNPAPYEKQLFLNRVSAILACAQAKRWQDVVDSAHATLAHFYFYNHVVSGDPRHEEKALSYATKTSKRISWSPKQALQIANYYLFAPSKGNRAEREIKGLGFLYIAARAEGKEGQSARELLLGRLAQAHPEVADLNRLSEASGESKQAASLAVPDEDAYERKQDDATLAGLEDGRDSKQDTSGIDAFFKVVDPHYKARIAELARSQQMPSTTTAQLLAQGKLVPFPLLDEFVPLPRPAKRALGTTARPPADRSRQSALSGVYQLPLCSPRLTYCGRSRSRSNPRSSPRFNYGAVVGSSSAVDAKADVAAAAAAFLKT